MRKIIIGFVFSVAILALVGSSLYGSNVDDYQLRLISMRKGQAELIGNGGLKHNIGISSKGVCIDTMTWCNGVPFGDVSQYVVAYDSMLNWFRPVANCSLYEVHGMFASGGTAKLFVCRYGYFSSDSSHPWPVIDNELPTDLSWNVSGSGGWEVVDFTSYPESAGFVRQFPGDSLFGVGYRSDNEAKPHIFYDDYSQHTFIPFCEDHFPHWRFTYEHDGHWYFFCPWPWSLYPELNMRAVVNYYEGVPPFVESIQQKSNTWLRENIRITALLSDLDGWIAEATLHYTVSGSGDTAEVVMSISMAKWNRFLATGYLPGPFSIGDTISYWCTCVDNDGKPSRWTGECGDEVKSFVIKEPQNPGAQILLVGDGNVNKQRSKYYKDLLERLGYSYEPTWFTEENKGIDSSVVLHTYEGKGWDALIWFGWGCGYLPWPDTLESESEYPLIRYLNDGGKFLLADQDYFWRKGIESGIEVSFEPGEFAYDYLGIQSCISDPNMQDTISLGDTIFYGVDIDDPVSGDFVDEPVVIHLRCIGIANWGDYTQATAQGVNIFKGGKSGEYSGTRLGGANGFKTVFLPWCFGAIVDCADTSTLTLQADTLMRNILHDWFGLTGVQTIRPGFVPRSFSLAQNYPNPFNPVTQIRYALPRDCWVRLDVFNILGKRVASLIDRKQRAGYKTARWDASLFASGIYFYRLRSGGFVETRRMILLK